MCKQSTWKLPNIRSIRKRVKRQININDIENESKTKGANFFFDNFSIRVCVNFLFPIRIVLAVNITRQIIIYNLFKNCLYYHFLSVLHGSGYQKLYTKTIIFSLLALIRVWMFV